MNDYNIINRLKTLEKEIKELKECVLKKKSHKNDYEKNKPGIWRQE